MAIAQFRLLHIFKSPFIRVARWFVFKPKIQIWVNFRGSCYGRCRYILWTVGPIYGLFVIFYGHLV
jgi:hypothetical protein